MSQMTVKELQKKLALYHPDSKVMFSHREHGRMRMDNCFIDKESSADAILGAERAEWNTGAVLLVSTRILRKGDRDKDDIGYHAAWFLASVDEWVRQNLSVTLGMWLTPVVLRVLKWLITRRDAYRVAPYDSNPSIS